MTGLCGNFDLKTVNELRTPDNFELTNSQEFGNSWTAVEVHGKRRMCLLVYFASRFFCCYIIKLISNGIRNSFLEVPVSSNDNISGS